MPKDPNLFQTLPESKFQTLTQVRIAELSHRLDSVDKDLESLKKDTDSEQKEQIQIDLDVKLLQQNVKLLNKAMWFVATSTVGLLLKLIYTLLMAKGG